MSGINTGAKPASVINSDGSMISSLVGSGDPTHNDNDFSIHDAAQHIVNAGQKFSDDEFGLEQQFAFGSLRKTKIYWRRPGDLSSQATLFPQYIDAATVRQGRIGDCFFVAALSLLCSDADAIRRLFVTQEMNEAGIYWFRFFEQGRWRRIVIDDRLPTRKLKSSYRLLLARSSNANTFWISLVEKAYAKLYGSYRAIRGGNISEALVDLTGAPVHDYNLDTSTFNEGQFWRRLLERWRRKALIGCAMCRRDIADDDGGAGDDDDDELKTSAAGIQPNHAYSVVTMMSTRIEGTRYRLILVQNPQRDGARSAFSGRFSHSERWSDVERRVLSTMVLAPGIFWMTWKEFRCQFNRVYVADHGLSHAWQLMSMQGAWTPESAGGCTDYSSWRSNPAYIVTGDVVAISLQQRDRRQETSDGSNRISYPMIGITIVRAPAPDDNPFLMAMAPDNSILARTSFWNKRDVAIEIKKDWGRPIIVVPSTHEPNITCEFVLNVYSETSGTITPRSQEMRESRKAGSWTARTSGGGPASPTFTGNPKFVVNLARTLSEASLIMTGTVTIFIGLRQAPAPLATRPKIGICVLKNARLALETMEGSLGSLDRSWFIGKTGFVNQEEVHRVIELNLDMFPIMVVPCTWQTHQVADFELCLYWREKELPDAKLTIERS